MDGYGNAVAVETTNRFPQRLGNLAENARSPHFHSRFFFVSEKNKTQDKPLAPTLERRDKCRRIAKLEEEFARLPTVRIAKQVRVRATTSDSIGRQYCRAAVKTGAGEADIRRTLWE